MEEKGETSEQLLLKMALGAHCDSCYQCLLQISTTTNRGGTIHSLLQQDERSGIKRGDGINSTYNCCYLAPRQLIPSSSYISCQMNKIFRNIYIKC